MADNWKIFPPWTSEHGPTNISLGSLIRNDFDVVEHTTKLDIQTSLLWKGLSRQEVSNLRNLANSKALRGLLCAYGYGISTGAEVDMLAEKDSSDAEFDLTIHSNQAIPQASMSEIKDFIKWYKVE